MFGTRSPAWRTFSPAVNERTSPARGRVLRPRRTRLSPERKEDMTNRMRLKNERGQTMTEFALVLPVLALVLFAVIQFGIVFNNYVTLTDATRAGARKAAVGRHVSDPVGSA